MTRNDGQQDRLERATSARLAKLASRSVDTSGLERRMQEALREDGGEATSTSPLLLQRWWRPILSAAAAALIVVTIGWLVLDGGTTPVMAAPTELAQIHFDVSNQLTPHLQASSVAEANRLLAEQSDDFTPLPEMPGKLRSCCLHQLAGTTITCALVELDGGLITVAVGDGEQVHAPPGKTITRGGKQFIAHTANGTNMVMVHEGNYWLCVVGDETTEKLLELAVDIKV